MDTQIKPRPVKPRVRLQCRPYMRGVEMFTVSWSGPNGNWWEGYWASPSPQEAWQDFCKWGYPYAHATALISG